MADTINVRIPAQIEQKLAEYCTQRGVTRSAVVVRALAQYLDRETAGATPYSLVADLMPPRGVKALRSRSIRSLARKAFRGSGSG